MIDDPSLIYQVMLEVLIRGIKDAYAEMLTPTKPVRYFKVQRIVPALEWFTDTDPEDENVPFTLDWICRELGIDSARLRDDVLNRRLDIFHTGISHNVRHMANHFADRRVLNEWNIPERYRTTGR